MDLSQKINVLKDRYNKHKETILTEESTKNSLIMPLIQELGYNPFDPEQVVPEFNAHASLQGVKKGDKVDYAIKKDGKIVLLVEAKWSGCNLKNEHASQLCRYFTATEAKFALLTNGLDYWFYTDLTSENKMDDKPFFTFNILNMRDRDIRELSKFSDAAFSIGDILNNADRLKYLNNIKKYFQDNLDEPSEDFAKFILKQVYDGTVITKAVLDKYTPVVKDAFKQFLNDKFYSRLEGVKAINDTEESETENICDDNGIVTTEEEIEGHHIIKAILRKVCPANKVVMRDQKSYCGILFDDNNRKPIARLHFNTSQKYLGVFENKQETKHPIDSIDDIYNFEEALIKTIQEYE